ncbi:Transcription antitermination protein nusG [Anaerobiospirillum thomasii]|uniref:Transcription termination/antitermination protein NusG n=1 Tax=Anaerobiospirillum thomasii TaxID=179995 RepID=A0A2X0WU08_9GAMM|nr:transcription termination/antitermination protein NusG [Anaerobiospirillum thomasii]SPT68951.1 Transcription antitermination protein nusG [Anaerobiospirillum thomasii]SPT71193.1 Transcription antitermination protein nusG [Anaerobiospirillum thomasii]
MSEFDNAQLPGIEDVILPQSSEVEEKKEEQVKPASPAKETAKQASFEKKPLRWYVVQAFSGYEQRVAATLRERIAIHGMQDDFGEVLVPKEKVKEIKDGKKRESERKFFPGYVLIQMRMSSDSWQLVKRTDRVLGFIGGTPDRPLPITEAEANKILSRLRESEESPRPKTMFEVGESVRAIDGAFKDFVGTVEKVDYEKNRLTVSIAIFGRATPVELEFGQVEKDL